MPLTQIAALIILSEQTVLVTEDHDHIERCVSQQRGISLCGGGPFPGTQSWNPTGVRWPVDQRKYPSNGLQ